MLMTIFTALPTSCLHKGTFTQRRLLFGAIFATISVHVLYVISCFQHFLEDILPELLEDTILQSQGYSYLYQESFTLQRKMCYRVKEKVIYKVGVESVVHETQISAMI